MIALPEKVRFSGCIGQFDFHKAGLHPASGYPPDDVAVNETVMQLNNKRYWLYAAVGPDSNESFHTKPEPTRTNALADIFFAQRRQKHSLDDAVFPVNNSVS